MPKKFNEVFLTAKNTVYGEIDNALVLAASMNSIVKFKPILSPNGSNAIEKYNVQIAKRNKSKSIGKSGTVSTSSGDLASMTTADNLAILDSFGKYDWDTEEITTGELRGIGHKIGWNDEYDADNLGSTQANFISTEVGEAALKRKEELLSKIIDGGTWAGEIDLSATGTPAYDQATAAIRKIRKVSDDFKHRTAMKNILILVDTPIKDKMAKEMGTAFQKEQPIYTTGLKSKFSVNGVPVLEVPELDQFISGDALNTDKVTSGIIVLDIETIAFKAANEMKGVDVNLGATRFVGTLYYEISKVLTIGKSKERIQIYGLKGSKTTTPGVSDVAAGNPGSPASVDLSTFKGDVMTLTSKDRTALKSLLGLAANSSNADLQKLVDER